MTTAFGTRPRMEGTGLAFRHEPDERLTFASREKRDAAIVDLAMRGMPPSAIERRINTSRGVIVQVLCIARRRGVAVPIFRSNGLVDDGRRLSVANIRIDRALFDAIGLAARRRRLSATTLARRILDQVIEDDLVDAVLDDGQRTPGEPA